MALGAAFGGNLTLFAVTANAMVAVTSERMGQRIHLLRFMAYGVPATLLSLAAATLYVLITCCP